MFDRRFYLKHPELILASYDNISASYENHLEMEANVALWNVKSEQKCPQQVFINTVMSFQITFSLTYVSNLLFFP